MATHEETPSYTERWPLCLAYQRDAYMGTHDGAAVKNSTRARARRRRLMYCKENPSYDQYDHETKAYEHAGQTNHSIIPGAGYKLEQHPLFRPRYLARPPGELYCSI